MPPASTARQSAPDDSAPAVPAERDLPPLTRAYTAWLITSLAARLSRGATNYYTRAWGVGTTEYRLLMALGRADACSAIAAATAADIDKAAASRSLQVLREAGFVESVRHGREMEIRLTDAGRRLRASLQQATDRRDSRLTRGFSEAEIVRLRADLARLHDNLGYMNE